MVQDADGDGYGDASLATTACTAPFGHTADDTDCADDDAHVNLAQRVVGGLDTDCDGTTGEDGLAAFLSAGEQRDVTSTYSASSPTSVGVSSDGALFAMGRGSGRSTWTRTSS